MTTQPEVNIDIETIEPRISTEDEPLIVDAEEIETPAESSQQETETGDVSQETQPETQSKTEIKQVEGETPKEYALRLEVTRLKRKQREERKQEIGFQEQSTPKEESVIEGYDPEELEKFEKVFEAVAEKKGYVRKDELHKTTMKERFDDVKDAFLDKHPEYLPENDKDDVLWNTLKGELGIYKTPQNAKELETILNKAHNSIFGSRSNMGVVKAQQSKIKMASHSGVQAGSLKKTASVDSDLKEVARNGALKGFTQAEIEELFS